MSLRRAVSRIPMSILVATVWAIQVIGFAGAILALDWWFATGRQIW